MGYRLWVIEAFLLLSTVFVFGQSPYITINQTDVELLQAAKVLGRKTQTLTLENYPQNAEKILQYLENHGYPFASVNLTTEWENDTTPLYVMHIDRGRYTRIDSIVLDRPGKVRQARIYYMRDLRGKAARIDERQA